MITSLFKSKRAKSTRERIIAYVIQVLQEKEHEDIRAVFPDFEHPQRVVRESTGEWYLPEVTASKLGQFRIFAVETPETLRADTTDLRWRLFSDFARQNNALFYIVFSAGLVLQIKEKLRGLQIDARLWQESAP